MKRLPETVDLEYELRMTLYSSLKPYMDPLGKSDFLVKVVAKEQYYKVYLESLGDESYTTPIEFLDAYEDIYSTLKLPDCCLNVEYEIAIS
jgi:hypothetical protein